MPTRALALTGGGAKTAFQVGAVHALQNYKGYEWDAVSGVSGGCLNGVMIAAGQEKDLVKLWLGLKTKDIYKSSFFHALWRLLCREPGLFSNKPLRKLLEKMLPEKTEVPFRYSAVDIRPDTPESVSMTEDNLSVDTVLASASIPGVWNPVKTTVDGKERLLIDGAVRDSFLVEPLLEFAPDEIVVIDCGRSSFDEISFGHPLLNVLVKAFIGAHDELQQGDIDPFVRLNKVLKQAEEHNESHSTSDGFEYESEAGTTYQDFKLLHISPEEDLGSPLDFSPATIDKRYRHGLRVAREMVLQ